MDVDNLSALVATLREIGSDIDDVEVKKASGGLPSSLRETLSAFSNLRGGTIILGLDEKQKFETTGITDPAKMSADLASMCASEMEPPVRPIIKQVQFEGAWLVVADVPEIESGLKPCFYKGRGINTGSFVRVHDGNQQLSSYEVQMMVANRGQPMDDLTPVEAASQTDLDDSLVYGYIDRLRTIRPNAFLNLSDKDVLIRSNVMTKTKNSDELSVTLAGLLALGSYPQQFYPQLSVTLVVYPTENGPDVASGTRFLDNVTLEGPIPVMARDALAAVRRNMRRRSTVAGVGRTEVWEYPEAALREAIVNAIVHRDLSSSSRGTQVQIEMYPNRLQVRNPGGLYGPVSVSQLTEDGTSSSRNSFLLKILEDVPLSGDGRTVCENRGSGIRTIVEALRHAGMTLPRFDDRISSFIVTFPNHALLDDDTVAWLNRLSEDGLTDSQCVGLAIMRGNDSVDNAAYRAATGVDSRFATSELADLVARELIYPVGVGRWTEYRLASRARLTQGEPSSRLAPRDRRQVVLDAIGTGSASRADIEERTGLGKQVVTHWLRVLRKEHNVQTVGSGPIQSRNIKYERTVQSWGQDTLDFDSIH